MPHLLPPHETGHSILLLKCRCSSPRGICRRRRTISGEEKGKSRTKPPTPFLWQSPKVLGIRKLRISTAGFCLPAIARGDCKIFKWQHLFPADNHADTLADAKGHGAAFNLHDALQRADVVELERLVEDQASLG